MFDDQHIEERLIIMARGKLQKEALVEAQTKEGATTIRICE